MNKNKLETKEPIIDLEEAEEYVTHNRLGRIYIEAIDKFNKGEEEHGPLNVQTDSRDFLQEAITELYDAMNYMAFEIMRLKDLQITLSIPKTSSKDSAVPSPDALRSRIQGP